MIHLNRDLSLEEQAALFQAMTVEQLMVLKGTPVKMDWSEDDLVEMAAYQNDENAPHLAVLQRMTDVEVNNFMLLKNMSMKEKMLKTGLSEIVIESIEKDATQAIYGDILVYCQRLGISKQLFLESFVEEAIL